MKITNKIFTALLFALTTMPGFCDIDCSDLANTVFDKCSDIVINSLISDKKAKCMQRAPKINPEIIGPMVEAMSEQISNFAAEIPSKPWIRAENLASNNKDKILPTLRQKCQEAVAAQQPELSNSISSVQTEKQDTNKTANEKTAEQKKFEKEYSTENNKELQNTVNKIAESTKQMKGGTVLTYDAKFKDFDGVLAELAKWEDACDSIHTDDIETAEPSFDYSDSAKVTATCEIVKCKKTGYQPSQDKKSCVKESFEDGEKCTPDSKQYKHAKAGKFNTEQNKCIPTECEDKFNLVDDECISDNKKDRMDRRDEKNDTKSFERDVKLLADAFDSLVKTKTDECTKKQGTIKGGECEEPVATAGQ